MDHNTMEVLQEKYESSDLGAQREDWVGWPTMNSFLTEDEVWGNRQAQTRTLLEN